MEVFSIAFRSEYPAVHSCNSLQKTRSVSRLDQLSCSTRFLEYNYRFDDKIGNLRLAAKRARTIEPVLDIDGVLSRSSFRSESNPLLLRSPMISCESISFGFAAVLPVFLNVLSMDLENSLMTTFARLIT